MVIEGISEYVSKYLYVSDGLYRNADEQDLALVYATRTATVAAVTPLVATALRAGDVAALPEDELPALRDAQIVVPDGPTELASVLSRQKTASDDDARLRYVLLPSSSCNMGCTYCGQQHLRQALGRDHRERVAERVLGGIARPTTQKVRISWFGGEPMMGYPIIRSLSKRFIASAAELGVDYDSSIVTNGTLLTLEKMRVLSNECQVVRYDITLDGPARIHDEHRPLKNGGKSFEHITSTLAQALDAPDLKHITIVLRTNVDVRNMQWVDEYLELITSLGFNHPRVYMNIAPVYSWGNDVSQIEVEREEFARNEMRWHRAMIRLGLRFNALPTVTIGALCAAVSQSAEIISSTGNVFSCSEYPLVPEHEATGGLGSVTSLRLLNKRPEGPLDHWHDSVARGQTPCQTCVMLPVCGGACPKQWREGNRACPPYNYGMPGRFDVIAEMNGLVPAESVEPGLVPACAAGLG